MCNTVGDFARLPYGANGSRGVYSLNWITSRFRRCPQNRMSEAGGGGGGVLPYKGLMGTCGQPGYVFRDFCLEQGIEFIIFCLNQGIDLSIFVLNWVKCLKQGIKNLNSVLKWVGKSAIFVLNRVRVWGAAPHLPSQGYIEYPPPPPPGGVRNHKYCLHLQFSLLFSASRVCHVFTLAWLESLWRHPGSRSILRVLQEEGRWYSMSSRTSFFSLSDPANVFVKKGMCHSLVGRRWTAWKARLLRSELESFVL